MKNTVLILILLISGYAKAQQVMLTPKQMQKDLAILKAELITLHPGLYRYNTPAQIETKFKQLEQKATVNKDVKAFYLMIAEFATQIKCGHTFLNPLNLSDSAYAMLMPKNVFPLFFKIIDNKIIVTHNVSEYSNIKPGDEIVSINIPTATVIKKLLQVSRADGNNAMGKKLSNINLDAGNSYGLALFDIFYPLYFGNSSSYKVQINHLNKKTENYTIAALTPQSRIEKYEARYGKIATDEGTWQFNTDSANIAYFKLGTFAFWNSDFNWKNYIDSVFTIIHNTPGISNLIIDLRGNEGGSGELRNYLLSYITNKPITGETKSAICYRYLSIPDTLLPYLSTWDRSFKKPKDPLRFITNELGLYEEKPGLVSNTADMDTIYPHPNSFKGFTVLLTDATCSSATFDMANTFQNNKLGRIIGEPTGGTKQGLNGGEMFFLTLPESKIEIDIPLIYYYTRNATDSGVLPDFVIYPNKQAIAAGNDNVLQYTHDKLKNNALYNAFKNDIKYKHPPYVKPGKN